MGAMAAGPQVRGVVARGKVLKAKGRRRGRRQCVRAVRRHAAMAGVLGTLMLLPTVQGLLHGAAGLLQVPPAIVACLGIAVAGWKSFLWGKRTTSWQGCSGARQSYAVRGGAEKQEQRQECKLERGEEQFEGTGLCNAGNTCYMNGVLQALFHSKQLCLRLQTHVAQRKCAADCATCLLWQTNELRPFGQADRATMEMWKPFLQAAGLGGGEQQSAADFAMSLRSKARGSKPVVYSAGKTLRNRKVQFPKHRAREELLAGTRGVLHGVSCFCGPFRWVAPQRTQGNCKFEGL